MKTSLNMGKGDRCAVYMCNNDRRWKDRLVVQDHVKEMKWHYCPHKYRALWQRLLRRKDLTITDNTLICSNHFVLGRPYGKHPHPCMFMEGYEKKESRMDNIKLQSVISNFSEPSNADKNMETRSYNNQHKLIGPNVYPQKEMVKRIMEDHCYCAASQDSEAENMSPCNKSSDHSYCSSSYSCYDLHEEHLYATKSVRDSECKCVKCDLCMQDWRRPIDERDALADEVEEFRDVLEQQTSEAPAILERKYDIANIKHSDKLVSLHTGLQCYGLFTWVFDLVKHKLPHLQYCKGARSETVKSYQTENASLLSHENELLVTLMKLKLNLSELFLAHLFGTCSSLVSQIISTWLPLLSQELKPLIHWPTTEELKMYNPGCFRSYKRVAAIIDCTEVQIQRPFLTAKLMVACTPAGTVSFVSTAAKGNVSDKDLVKGCGILDKFLPGDTLLANRDFNIQELLLERSVMLVITPKEQLSEADDSKTKQVENARIHVERVIGQMKDFNIMKGELPLDMFDMLDHISIVVAGLVNLQPPIVPLDCN